jgi:DNA-binding GntR family transcriptional regulator
MSVEHGRPEALARAGRLIERLRKPDLDELERHTLVHDLAHAFFDANDNVVMQIVRRTLRSEIFGRLRDASLGLDESSFDSLRRAVSRKVVRSGHVEALASAVETRDGRAAYEAVHQLWGEFRATVRQVLEAARERSADEGPRA